MIGRLLRKLVDRFIARAQAREPHPIPVVRHEDRVKIFDRYQPPHEWPIGTNLLCVTQAEAMVRHMLDGMPPA